MEKITSERHDRARPPHGAGGLGLPAAIAAAAASDWGGPVELKAVRPSHPRSHERLGHESGAVRFLLPLGGDAADPEVRRGLLEPRLERAIGVIYRPETELQSHYFRAVLPRQFDEYVWFDESSAVTPLGREEREGMPDTYPFGL